MELTPVRRFYYFIERNFHLIFWPVLVAALIVGNMQLKDKTYLQNDAAPQGIVSLELGKSLQQDRDIIASWKSDTLDRSTFTACRQDSVAVNRLAIAKKDVHLDYLFILLYTTLAVLIIVTLQAQIQKEDRFFSHLLVCLAILAGVCDCIENLGLLKFIGEGLEQIATGSTVLNGASTHTSTHTGSLASGAAGVPTESTASLTRTMAIIKFSILGGLLLIYLPVIFIGWHRGLQRLSNYIGDKTKQLFKYRLIFLGVLIFSLPIYAMDQGQDLLVNSNSSDSGVVLFILVVMGAAFLNWYLAKLFFSNDFQTPVLPLTIPDLRDPALEKAEKKVSRFLGITTVLLPGAAVLHALEVLQIHSFMDFLPAASWLVLLLVVFFVLVRFDVAGGIFARMQQQGKGHKAARLAGLLFFIFGLLIPGLFRIMLNGEQRTPQSLGFLFWDLVSLAFAFYLFVSLRTCLFAPTSWLGDRVGRPIIFLSALLALVFILFNAAPGLVRYWDSHSLSLPVLQSGLILYILFFTLLIRLGLWRKINFLFFAFAIALLLSIKGDNNYHSVQLMNVPKAPARVTLKEYFRGWLLSRQNEIQAGKGEYPVFLVNSYGGGIKAAAFTNMFFSTMDSAVFVQSAKKTIFEHFVFSVSGASGGTIGSAVQCAYRASHPVDTQYLHAIDSFQRFYQHDFLTPVLENLLGADVLASATSLHLWGDRSVIQENTWQYFGAKTLHIQLGQEFNQPWDTGGTNPSCYEVPLLFSNTLNVDDGWKGICAPVDLDSNDFPGTIFIRRRVDFLNEGRDPEKDSLKSISLITGAFLSARFPYISPSGKMGPGYHFMDGGGKDNSGASTSQGIYLALCRLAADEMKKDTGSLMSHLLARIRIHFVSVTNNPRAVPDSRKLVSNRFEPISPIVGIINSGIQGNADAANLTLKHWYSGNPAPFYPIRSDYNAIFISGHCVPDKNGDPYSPVLPLGWQISLPSLQRMQSSFDPGDTALFTGSGLPQILDIVKER
jgi:hypothetical protein